MSKEVVISGSVTSGLVIASAGAAIYYSSSSLNVYSDETFNFNMYLEKVVGKSENEFETFGFDGSGSCVRWLLGSEVNVNVQVGKHTDISLNPSTTESPIDPESACLLADIYYSSNKDNQYSATAAKMEFVVLDKSKKKAVVFWTGFTNALEKSKGPWLSQKGVMLEKKDNKQSWGLQKGYVYDKTHDSGGKIVFEGLEGVKDEKIELEEPCNKDRVCEGILQRTWIQKKGAWIWKPAPQTNGISYMGDLPLKIKVGDKSEAVFFDKSVGSVLSLSLKDDKSKGSWSWVSCNANQEDPMNVCAVKRK